MPLFIHLGLAIVPFSSSTSRSIALHVSLHFWWKHQTYTHTSTETPKHRDTETPTHTLFCISFFLSALLLLFASTCLFVRLAIPFSSWLNSQSSQQGCIRGRKVSKLLSISVSSTRWIFIGMSVWAFVSFSIKNTYPYPPSYMHTSTRSDFCQKLGEHTE